MCRPTGSEAEVNRQRYVVEVHRQGRWWVIDAPAVDYRTQARTLADVDEMSRDLIAGALDVPLDAFDIDVRVATPSDVLEKLNEVAGLEREALSAQARAASERRAAAHLLTDAYGLSAIDAARVLGVSRGRVYQLLDEPQRA